LIKHLKYEKSKVFPITYNEGIWGEKHSRTLFLTLVPDGGVLSAPFPGHLPLRKSLSTSCTGGLGADLDGCLKFHLHRGSNPRSSIL